MPRFLTVVLAGGGCSYGRGAPVHVPVQPRGPTGGSAEERNALMGLYRRMVWKHNRMCSRVACQGVRMNIPSPLSGRQFRAFARRYRGTSLIRHRPPTPRTVIGPCAQAHCRILGGGVFLWARFFCMALIRGSSRRNWHKLHPRFDPLDRACGTCDASGTRRL